MWEEDINFSSSGDFKKITILIWWAKSAQQLFLSFLYVISLSPEWYIIENCFVVIRVLNFLFYSQQAVSSLTCWPKTINLSCSFKGTECKVSFVLQVHSGWENVNDKVTFLLFLQVLTCQFFVIRDRQQGDSDCFWQQRKAANGSVV